MRKNTIKEMAFKVLCDRGNLSFRELAEKHGLKLATLRSYARQLGFETKHKIPWSDDEIAILKKYAQSKTIVEVARMLPKRTDRAVSSKAANMGIPFRKYGEDHHIAKYKNEDVHYATLLLDDGMPHKEIAELLEVSVAFVKSVARGIRVNREEAKS